MNTARPYILGFIFSLVLTLCAPALLWLHEVNHHTFPTHTELGIAFVVFAITQLIVQLIFFLHLGQESKPKWNLFAFGLTVFMLVAIVGGTLWIMYNLAHMQMPQQPDVFSEENIFPHK